MASMKMYPYGYKLDYKGKKEVDEEKADVVRLIFKKYLSGMNRYAIMWHLINEKILRPRCDSYSWQYTMVNKILKDERYVGDDQRYPQIITREIFNNVQKRLMEEREIAISSLNENCNGTRKYPFSSFIECGSCGSKYIRGLQHVNSDSRKASWRCRDYKLKASGKCKASGNIYEETLHVVCVNAYNKQLKEFSNINVKQTKPQIQGEQKNSFEILIKETIQLMKSATDEHLAELEATLNMLIEKRTAISWDATTLDLSDFETQKIKKHFEENPKLMVVFDEACFKQIFEKIVALEPGELKLILKNGNEAFQDYKPMKGQVNNAKKCRSNTSQVT